MAVAMRLKQKRKERQDFTACRFLIATPGTFPLVLPAAARIHVSLDAANLTPEHVLTVGTREIFKNSSDADVAKHVGRFDAHVTLEKAAGQTNTVTVYVEDSFGRLFKIGEG